MKVKSFVRSLFPSFMLLVMALQGCGGGGGGAGATSQVNETPQARLASSLGGKLVFNQTVSQYIQISTMNPDGSGLAQLTNGNAHKLSPSWSPDRSQIAFYVSGSPDTLYTMNADGSNQARVNTGIDPSWSPLAGSREIAFAHSTGIFIRDLSIGIETQVTTVVPGGLDFQPNWSPDASKIVFSRAPVSNQSPADLYVINRNGDSATLVHVTSVAGREQKADWSPDGRTIAYDSNDTLYAVNVNPATGTPTGAPLTLTAGKNPAWSPDGSQLCFAKLHTGLLRATVVRDGSGNVTGLTGAVTILKNAGSNLDWK